MEGDHVLVAHLLQLGPSFRWREAQLLKVVVPGQLKHSQRAADIELAPVLNLGHQRVTQIHRAKGLLSGLGAIPGVDLFDGHHRQELVL